MIINAESIFVNNINMAPYITQANFGYNKMWSSDSGRNLAGTMSGTLIGIFPKIVLFFRPLTQTELETFAPIFDSASQTVQYYDPKKQEMTTMTTYTGDWEDVNKNVGYNEPFQLSFISTKRRT